jgi:hypothetical protein
MTDEEFQALIHRPQSDYDEEKIEYYRVMQEWDVFRRRHNANVFDVFFHDVQDEIGQGEVKDIVVDISARLGVAMPVIHDDAEALAYIKNKKKMMARISHFSIIGICLSEQGLTIKMHLPR